MYGVLLYYILGLKLLIFNGCSAEANTTIIDSMIISVFEYGVHVEGEEASFATNGVIQPFVPHYILNVTPTTRPDLEQRYTYLRVEYVSSVNVEINFQPDTFDLSFYIRFPFMSIPYGVVGYSLKHSISRVWSTWRKSLRKSKGIQNIMCLKGHP